MAVLAASAGIELSYAVAPDQTQAVLDGLSAAGELSNQVLAYVDEASGWVVSGTWSSFPPEMQQNIRRSGFFLGVAVGGLSGSTQSLASRLTLASTGTATEEAAEIISQGYFGQSRQFWSQMPVVIAGSKVYQRNDLIDPNVVSTWRERGVLVTGTNLERMASGRAPIGPDGQSLNLHHMTQTQSGAIAEVAQSFHQRNYNVIHINTGSLPSGIDRAAFDTWRTTYWQQRALNWSDQ